jgi:hypothetical protein
MNYEAIPTGYRGILCLYCSQPIPIPARAKMLESESHKSQPDNRSEEQPQVILLRCKCCEKEAPYAVAEIAHFQGPAKPFGQRRSRLAGATSHPRQIPKAANS